MEMIINGATFEIDDCDELRARIAEAAMSQFLEIWLQGGAQWPAICALVNNEAAWLMFVRHEGDAGFSTTNPSYAGPQDAAIEYYLSNGQRDEYPASWNITTAEARRALEYFFEHKAMAPWLSWRETQLAQSHRKPQT
jgi:hypothetical protein